MCEVRETGRVEEMVANMEMQKLIDPKAGGSRFKSHTKQVRVCEENPRERHSVKPITMQQNLKIMKLHIGKCFGEK